MHTQSYVFLGYGLSGVLKILLFFKYLLHIRHLGSFYSLMVQYISQRIIDVEILKTQRFTSTVFFTGLT